MMRTRVSGGMVVWVGGEGFGVVVDELLDDFLGWWWLRNAKNPPRARLAKGAGSCNADGDNGEVRAFVRSCVAAYLGMTNAPRTRFSTCRHLTRWWTWMRGVTLSPCNTPSSPCVPVLVYGSGLGVL
jgi:hypothetical protein